MLKHVLKNVVIEELNPEQPQEGARSYRVIQYTDPEEMALFFEVYETSWEWEELDSYDCGPQATLSPSAWRLIGWGMGGCSVEDAMAQAEANNNAVDDSEIPW